MNADPRVVICIRSAQLPVRSYPDPIRIIPVATDSFKKNTNIPCCILLCVKKSPTSSKLT